MVRGLAYPCADPSNPRSPIVADPHAAVEWPVASWRNADYEIFSVITSYSIHYTKLYEGLVIRYTETYRAALRCSRSRRTASWV